jgi:hypothetical protein
MTGLEAEDTGASFSVNTKLENDSYENQDER